MSSQVVETKVPTTLEKTAQALQENERKKKLTTRIRNHANAIANRINEKVKEEGSEDETYKMSYIRRAILWLYTKIAKASAWFLDQVEKIAAWITDMLSVGTRPVTATYYKVRDFVKGEDPAAEAKLAA